MEDEEENGKDVTELDAVTLDVAFEELSGIDVSLAEEAELDEDAVSVGTIPLFVVEFEKEEKTEEIGVELSGLWVVISAVELIDQLPLALFTVEIDVKEEEPDSDATIVMVGTVVDVSVTMSFEALDEGMTAPPEVEFGWETVNEPFFMGL